jgi:hypothetical protein
MCAEKGMNYRDTDLVVLDEPDAIERSMALNLVDGGVVMIREGNKVVIKRGQQVDRF